MKFFEQFDVKQLENLELLAKQVVEGFIIGLHKSPFHGFSVEFAEHRLYNPGEATKDIDWKVYARSDKMFIKKYEEETNLRCQIIMDTSSSMYYPEVKGKLNKLQFSAVAAACIMNLLKKQRDSFGLSMFDHQLIAHTGCKSSTTHYQLLLTYLERLISDEQEQKTTAAADALHQIADAIHKRSMVIIFSDMFDNGEDMDQLFSALQHLKYAKHEVIVFHVTDKAHELEFEFENRPYEFIDLESGDKVKLQSNEIKSFYTSKVKAYTDQLKMKCLQYKIEFVETDINEGFNQVLQTYLVKRGKMQ
ncbi:MAG: DUF58 domain-containing protein [Saprospiraceae bacterium]|nr:DUF58 domain-containing protein [Saprospiraceae bacterium]